MVKCLSPLTVALACSAGAIDQRRILVKQFATLDCTGDHSEDYVEDGGCDGTDIFRQSCSHFVDGNVSDTHLECRESHDQPGSFDVLISWRYSFDSSCSGDKCTQILMSDGNVCQKGDGGDKSWQVSCVSSDEPVPDPTPEPPVPEPSSTPEPGPDPTPDPGPGPTTDPTPEPGPDPTPAPLVGVQIQHKGTSLCVDLPGGDTSNGALLWTWDCYGGDTQQWAFQDGQWVYLPEPSKCVDMLGGDSTKGKQLGLWDCNQGSSQMWGVDEEAGTIYLASSTDATKCVAIGYDGFITSNGDTVRISDCAWSDDLDSFPWRQLWTITPLWSTVVV